MNKITKTFLFFSLIVLFCIAGSSCQSSRTAYTRKSAATGKDYVRKKKKSGNKRANHRSSSTGSRTASKSSGTSKSRPPFTAGTGSRHASHQAEQVVKAARSYLGTPYKYAGSTRKGMDCSGLLCTSFESVQVKLPRTSHEQANYGKDVSLSDVEPGDLVFFAERKGSNKVSHVGMVTAVRAKNDVTFIHSSTSRGVVEDKLFAEYYQKIFVKAIRPL